MIAPGVHLLLPGLLWTDGLLPAVGVPEALSAAVNHAAARETHEFGIELVDGLGKVPAQAVALECVLRNEGDHINVYAALCEAEELEACIGAVLCGGEGDFIFLPSPAAGLELGLPYCHRNGKRTSLDLPARHERNFHIPCLSVGAPEEDGEIIFLTCLEHHSAEAGIGYAYAGRAAEIAEMADSLDVETHIVRIVLVERSLGAGVHVSGGMAVGHISPRGSGAPSGLFGKVVLEGAVLHELGIETAVAGVADVLDEYAEELVADGLAPCRRHHRLLCGSRKRGKSHRCDNQGSFHPLYGYWFVLWRGSGSVPEQSFFPVFRMGGLVICVHRTHIIRYDLASLFRRKSETAEDGVSVHNCHP